MTYGTVKWFSPQMGFGYIDPEGGGAPVAVMGGALVAAGMNAVRIGQRLSYDPCFNMDDGEFFAMSLRSA